VYTAAKFVRSRKENENFYDDFMLWQILLTGLPECKPN